MIGLKFNMLTVTEVFRVQPKGFKCKVICDCGVEKLVYKSNLISGKTKSCGCLLLKSIITHGMRRNGASPQIYTAWCNMKARCEDKKHPAYKNYGGRGIKICNEWQKFENFFRDMGVPSKGLSLDRVDNNANYCKENCRWATRATQNFNKRNNVFYKGESAKKASLRLSDCRTLVTSRLRRGWSLENAFNIPSTPKVKKHA